MTVSRKNEYLIPLEKMGNLHLHVLVAAAPPNLARAALEVHHRPCTQLTLSSTPWHALLYSSSRHHTTRYKTPRAS